jgi:hypothetical protein
MLPLDAGGKPLTSVARDGSPVFYTTQTIKGVHYAVFAAVAGRYEAVYTG